MASFEIKIEDIGTVKVFRRKGLKNIRITLDHDGSIRLSMPWFVPKAAGVKYVLSKKEWINKHRKKPFTGWRDGHRLGDKYTLRLDKSDRHTVAVREERDTFHISVPKSWNEQKSQQAVAKSVSEFIRAKAKNELPPLLKTLARQNGYKLKDIKIRKLKSRWGSCNQQRVITLNMALIALPDDLAEYVMVHELAHTRHLHHGKDFWQEVASVLPDCKERRKALKEFNPAGFF